MKKLFFFFVAALAVATSAQAGEYVVYQPAEPVTICWGGEGLTKSQPSIDGSYFKVLAEGDVIKIHTTNVANSPGYELIWRGKTDDEWRWVALTDIDTSEDGVIKYTVKEESYKIGETVYTTTADKVAASIKNRGIVINGINYKMLDVTVQSDNVENDGSYIFRTLVSESKSLGEEDGSGDGAAWSPFVDLRYCDYSNVKVGDIIRIAYSVTENKEGQIQLQNNWGKYGDGDATDKGGLSGTGSVDFTITAEMLNIMKETGSERDNNFVLKGKNTTITGVSLITYSTPAGYRPVYIPTSGYATFYGKSTLALPDGVEAYYVSATTSETATLTPISNIPANQGVILKGNEGICQLYTTTDDAASVNDNKLVGAINRTQITDASKKYVLYNNNGTPEFRKITADTYLDAYKCYLSTAAFARLSIIFDDNYTTGIETINHETVTGNLYYDLSGRRVANPTKGLYIINGKKVIMK